MPKRIRGSPPKPLATTGSKLAAPGLAVESLRASALIREAKKNQSLPRLLRAGSMPEHGARHPDNPWLRVGIHGNPVMERPLISSDQPGWSRQWDCFVLAFIMAGQGMADLAGHPLDLRAGMILLIPPNHPVRFQRQGERPMDLALLGFDWTIDGRSQRLMPGRMDWSRQTYEIPPIGSLAIIALAREAQILPHRILSAHHRNPDPAYAWLEVDIQLLRALQRLREERADPLREPRPRHPRATMAMRYLYEHVCEPVRLTDVARHAGTSVATLCREFRSQFGSSPGKFLAEQRMNQARRLLDSPDFSIREIAKLCGYASPQVFSRSFRYIHGMSPRAYRKRP